MADVLAEGKIVGHFSGRAEFGPRALGHRSLLGDPRNPEMQTRMNVAIKFRESFRPFAPSVIEGRQSEYPAILNGRTIDSKSQANRPSGRSLPEVPPERPSGERPLTKSTYPLKTSESPNFQI